MENYMAINADFRDSKKITYAYQHRADASATIVSDPEAFLDAIRRAQSNKIPVFNFNGTSYIFGEDGLMGVLPLSKVSEMAKLCGDTVDVMACFFAEHGYKISRRRIEIVTEKTPTGIFLCDEKAPNYNHSAVLRELLDLVATFFLKKRCVCCWAIHILGQIGKHVTLIDR